MSVVDEGLPIVPNPTNKNRKLRPDKLIATSRELANWIRQEFPSAHLSDVADDVYALTTEAVAKAEKIRRPMYWLRLLLTVIFAGLAFGVYWHYTHHSEKEFMDLVNSLKPLGVFAGSAVIFVITLETRFKRWKALKAVHELQSVVHIIDMHQLGKDPMIEQFRHDPNDVEVKIEQYLHCCTALIAIVSKIGQLYLDHFYDSSATTAVNEFEAVATGTSTKIWSKILHLGQIDLYSRHHDYEDETPVELTAVTPPTAPPVATPPKVAPKSNIIDKGNLFKKLGKLRRRKRGGY